MNRKIYIADDCLALEEYCNELDTKTEYDCWQDPDTQKGYNFQMDMDYEKFKNRPVRSRFRAVIQRKEDGAIIGFISLSPEQRPPDLAIMLLKEYRGHGYGTAAFSLALQYCFEAFALDKIYAGCYEGNTASLKMLQKCGFVPYPEGNEEEEHYLNGLPITQYDYVKMR